MNEVGQPRLCLLDSRGCHVPISFATILARGETCRSRGRTVGFPWGEKKSAWPPERLFLTCYRRL
jgi:hypothetical protein